MRAMMHASTTTTTLIASKPSSSPAALSRREKGRISPKKRLVATVTHDSQRRNRLHARLYASRSSSNARRAEHAYVIEPFHAIVGARKARRVVGHRDFEELQRVDRERGAGGIDTLRAALDRERIAHGAAKDELKRMQAAYAPDHEVRAVKAKKLRLKDAVVALERELEAAERTTPVGEGTYGKVFEGKDAVSGEAVAVKIEDVASSGVEMDAESLLRREYDICKRVHRSAPRCFPKPRYFGRQNVMGRESRVLVMDILGPSLEEMSMRVNGGIGFSSVTTARIAKRLFSALEAMHRERVVHGDVKPDNLLTERRKPDGKIGSAIMLVDFGESIEVSEEYLARAKDTLVSQDGWRGTVLFSSVNVDAGHKISMRDDLESAIYTLAYLRTGRLPWSHELDEFDGEIDIRSLADAKYAVADGASLLTPHGVSDVPSDYRADISFFDAVLRHARNLAIDDEPDYRFLAATVAEWRADATQPYDWISHQSSP
jgi:hypothetical protein